MSQLATTLWWMLLYPFSAAVGVAMGYLVYLLLLIVPPLAGAPRPHLFALCGKLLGLLIAGDTFVRTTGRLAPACPTRAAGIAFAAALGAAVAGAHDHHAVAAASIAGPLTLGALAGLAHTYVRERKALRAAEADQREAASPQKPA